MQFSSRLVAVTIGEVQDSSYLVRFVQNAGQQGTYADGRCNYFSFVEVIQTQQTIMVNDNEKVDYTIIHCDTSHINMERSCVLNCYLFTYWMLCFPTDSS